MKRLLAGAVIVTVLAGAGPSRPTPAQRGHCRSDETVVYSCQFGAKHGSVCAAPGRIAYRFGASGKPPELAIASAPDWENVRIGRIVCGGGGYQNHLRFTRGDYHYIVFEAAGGGLTEVAGKRWSGISVWRGETEMPARACKLQSGGVTGTLDKAWDFVPAARRRAVAEDEPRFEAWF